MSTLKQLAIDSLNGKKIEPSTLISVLQQSLQNYSKVATGDTSWFASKEKRNMEDAISFVEGVHVSMNRSNPELTKEILAAKAKFKLFNGEISKVLSEEWNALFSSPTYSEFEKAIKSKVLEGRKLFYPIINRLLEHKFRFFHYKPNSQESKKLFHEQRVYLLLTGELRVRDAHVEEVTFTEEEKQRLKTILEEKIKNRDVDAITDLRLLAVHTGESPEYLQHWEAIAESKRLASQKGTYKAWFGGKRLKRKRRTAKRRSRK
jgi:hypothetical protein